MNWRRIFLGKLAIAALLLLAAFYCWLHGLGIYSSARRRFHRPEYFEKSPFRLQQNGDYWILNDFILAGITRHGNQSITLTTHGTYMDLKYLEYLIVRWNAPISLALYVHTGDFETIITSFHNLKYCSISGLGFGRYVTVQLVMHKEHMPRYLRRMEAKPPLGFRCGAPYEMDIGNSTLSLEKYSKYPLHLLKNVARLNARTYYVFPLELNMLPVKNFVNNFILFVQFQDFQKPLRSVFCVPVFPQLGEKIYQLKYKSHLVAHLKSYLNGSLPLTPSLLKQLKDMEFWLKGTKRDDELCVLRVEKSHQQCMAHVAINAYEPLYDQRFAESALEKNTSMLQLLAALDFDFVLLDGAFVIHQPQDPKTSHSEYASTQAQPHQIRNLIKLNSLAMRN